jgi:hypothetical protein
MPDHVVDHVTSLSYGDLFHFGAAPYRVGLEDELVVKTSGKFRA